ncbi:MAG: helix-turn-helix domain-containing protein [Caenispirillum sp.]|nr:helix-turn-helix domain-containing protein [Caenispirillum sp.]
MSNSEHDEELGTPLPASALELGTRLSTVVEALGGRSAAAEAADVSPTQITRYTKGRNVPPFDVVARLCAAAGVSMEWVATGRGEMRPAAGHTAAPAEPNLDMLRDIVRQLAELMEEEGLRPRPSRFADLVVAVYQQHLADSASKAAAGAGVSAAGLRGFLRLVR